MSEKEDGINSKVEQFGRNFSGGQKQRLNIARALIKKPKLLIFDDSFSALDYKTDLDLRKSIKNNFSDTTVIMVSQRVSSIKNADKIIVLDNGNMVGLGKHEELLLNCNIYMILKLMVMHMNKDINVKETLFKIFKYIKPYKWLIVLNLVFSVLVVLTTLYVPILTGKIIDLFIGESKVDLNMMKYFIGVLIICISIII